MIHLDTHCCNQHAHQKWRVNVSHWSTGSMAHRQARCSINNKLIVVGWRQREPNGGIDGRITIMGKLQVAMGERRMSEKSRKQCFHWPLRLLFLPHSIPNARLSGYQIGLNHCIGPLYAASAGPPAKSRSMPFYCPRAQYRYVSKHYCNITGDQRHHGPCQAPE